MRPDAALEKVKAGPKAPCFARLDVRLHRSLFRSARNLEGASAMSRETMGVAVRDLDCSRVSRKAAEEGSTWEEAGGASEAGEGGETGQESPSRPRRSCRALPSPPWFLCHSEHKLILIGRSRQKWPLYS